MSIRATPFVKFVGGKTQLLPTLYNHMPERFGTYFEPFLGGGALFLSLACETNRRFSRAVLGDVNEELVNVWRAVQTVPGQLSEKLCAYEEAYAKEGEKETFYKVRALDPKELAPLDAAARFIFLNKTCFNGMYRVNKSGKFNVPWCRKFGPVSTHLPSNLVACKLALECADVVYADFQTLLGYDEESGTLLMPQPGDFVYFDPPYQPLSKTANFTEYVPGGFDMADQSRLAKAAAECRDIGASVMVSNSDVPEIRDLYERLGGFEIHRVNEKRNINSKPDARGAIGALLIIGRP